MSHLVVLNLGNGDWQTGLSNVIAQLWEADQSQPMQFTGSLPPMPELGDLYERWRSLYEALYSNLGWRRSTEFNAEFDIDEADLTHISHSEFSSLSDELRHEINRWLSTHQFQKIERQLRTRLNQFDEIRVIVVADNSELLKLPWCLWDFLEDYPKVEIALSLPEYTRAIKTNHAKSNTKVKILAILGDRKGIDLDRDQQLLKQLPRTELKFLVEPQAKDLTQQLWQPGWDVLFFAGHSSSQGKGRIQINHTESLTIDQLKYGLRKAIANGLKLAIFNSCDGLGLARDLADLHLPQVIVMRESVPDRVAQEFLKHFLTAFSSGQSLYTAVREAREKLQPLEADFPCATWLPVICQNPAEVPPTWQDWCGKPAIAFPRPTRHDLQKILLSSLAVTSLITGIRWLGWLQPTELAAFDTLTRSRPAENPDPRLLVVTITEKDMQAQGPEPRQGSLSERTLSRLLAKLEDAEPLAIGLDIYRDFPASSPDLKQQLNQPNLIAICKRPAPPDDPAGILPPPEVPEEQVGFSDFVQDSDGAIRRHLLFMSPNPTSPCTPAYAFNLQLAFRYLNARDIAPKFTPDGDLQLKNVTFPSFEGRVGGYQTIDTRGNQILLNYRHPQAIAQQVTLTQILNGQVNPRAIRDRIVLIGVASPNSGDYWSTPYGTSLSSKLPGVLIQAQMVSQILSVVFDGRPLLWVWSQWGEVIWIGGWSLVGGILGWRFEKLALVGSGVLAIVLLTGLGWLLFLQGGWVPIVPPVLTLVLTSIPLIKYK
ncbi:CHASE2 domain-containing protein [Phormidesmis sp. 146-33]